MTLPAGTRFYMHGQHYEITGHGQRDGQPARYVRRLTATMHGRANVTLKIPVRVKTIEKYANIRQEEA